MPTLFACGVQQSSYPSDSDIHLEESCPECCGQSDDDDYGDRDDYYRDDEDRTTVALHGAERAVAAVTGLSLAPGPSMFCPNIVREVSCEWEASSGVATALHALELLAARNPLANLSRFDHHDDATCDGELVFSRLRLWERPMADAYRVQLATLERLRDSDEVAVTFAAGHHIHVSARHHESQRGLSPNNLVSLYSVFAHCEDILYRFAAAGWSQHRSERDGSYSSPMLKVRHGQPRTARNVGNAIGSERYQGLNVTPYLQQIQRCGCGAYRFGEWESCDCGDNGATVEWRLWNAAVSPRKIRAYIALSAVLTEYASSVDVREVNELEEHPFQGTDIVHEERLEAQLDYLLAVPGFTARDRDDIRWLASISPGMGSIATEYESSRDGRHSSSPSPFVS